MEDELSNTLDNLLLIVSLSLSFTSEHHKKKSNFLHPYHRQKIEVIQKFDDRNLY